MIRDWATNFANLITIEKTIILLFHQNHPISSVTQSIVIQHLYVFMIAKRLITVKCCDANPHVLF